MNPQVVVAIVIRALLIYDVLRPKMYYAVSVMYKRKTHEHENNGVLFLHSYDTRFITSTCICICEDLINTNVN